MVSICYPRVYYNIFYVYCIEFEMFKIILITEMYPRHKSQTFTVFVTISLLFDIHLFCINLLVQFFFQHYYYILRRIYSMKGEGCFVLTTIDLNVRVEINIYIPQTRVIRAFIYYISVYYATKCFLYF